MPCDEGMAVRNGEKLNIQCLVQAYKRERRVESPYYHYHKYIELLYFLEGSANVLIGEERLLCQKGELFVIYANEPHSFEHISQNKYLVIKFLPDVLRTTEQSINEFEYIFNFNIGRHSRIIRDDNMRIKKLFVDAYEKFNEDKYSNELFVRSDLIRICAEIINFWYRRGEIIPISSAAGRENLMAIQKVIERTKETKGALKTHDAAQLCNMSDGHFSRIFRAVMNMPFMQYVKSVKIEEAERLLMCTDETVTDIAQILNYASASHFIEDFRKQKGVSPKQYKKCLKNTLDSPVPQE